MVPLSFSLVILRNRVNLRRCHSMAVKVKINVVKVAAPMVISQVFWGRMCSILGWVGSRLVLKVHQADRPMIVPETLYVVLG